MSSMRQHVHALVDRLPAAQLNALAGLLESMVDPLSRAITLAPVDEESLTEGEEQAIERAEAWLETNGGRGISHDEVLAEFGLSTKDFPLNR